MVPVMDMVVRATTGLTATGKSERFNGRMRSEAFASGLNADHSLGLSPRGIPLWMRRHKLIPFCCADLFDHRVVIALSLALKLRLVFAKLHNALLDIGARRRHRIFFHFLLSFVVVPLLRRSARFPPDCGVNTATYEIQGIGLGVYRHHKNARPWERFPLSWVFCARGLRKRHDARL